MYIFVLQGGSTSNLNMNLYATKKTAAEGMLDIALFLANITHMKTVIEQGAGYRYSMCVWEDKVLHGVCKEDLKCFQSFIENSVKRLCQGENTNEWTNTLPP